MNSDLKALIVSYMQVVSIVLMVSAIVAFVSIPYSLGNTPGNMHIHVNGSDMHAS